MAKWRVSVIQFVCTTNCYVINFLLGYVIQRRRQVDFDYSKYLGPDYEKTYDGAGIHVINHTTPFETTLSLALMNPQVGLLGKKESVNVIGIKQIVYGLNFLLVGRDKKDSKEEREKMIKEIEAR